MFYIGLFVLIFALLQLVVAFTNLIFYCGVKNRGMEPNSTEFGLVSILIPARNEETNITNLLNDLMLQSYSKVEIIVFDDLSTDKTSTIVDHFSQLDARIRLIRSNGLPQGWLGKNHGCFTLSKAAKGDFFLFLDADVRINKDIIVNAIAHLRLVKVGLLSIFPKQIMGSIGEKVTVPNMNFILLSLLPLILVRLSKRASLAAANGQFMLFDAKHYKRLEPHLFFKSNRVEDISIARYMKSKGVGVSCLVGNNSVTCRMYNGFNEAVNGFSKNVISFFGDSYVMAVLFWIITTFGIVVIAYSMSIYIALSYLLVIIITRVSISIISKQSIFENLVFMVLQQITLAIFIYRAIINQLKKQHQWKGRGIS